MNEKAIDRLGGHSANFGGDRVEKRMILNSGLMDVRYVRFSNSYSTASSPLDTCPSLRRRCTGRAKTTSRALNSTSNKVESVRDLDVFVTAVVGF